jgi:hypothetical protein
MEIALAALLVAAMPASGSAAEIPVNSQMMPDRPALLAGHGNGGFPIRTDVPLAQAYFSNGMELGAAFDHAASKAAFAEATRLDPHCVMCAWGQAWAAGPNINFGVSGDDLVNAQRLAAHARKLALDHGTALERQLAAALVARYDNGGGSGTKGDWAYSKAMGKIAAAHPADDALQFLAADAVLNTMSDEDDNVATLKAKGRRAMKLLTPVLARSPDFTPAIHFYIHATESAGVPGYAEAYADRLPDLAPKAAHLVHMPSHTYYWIGRYRDAGLVNLRAMTIGMDQAAHSGAMSEHDPFALPYHNHNVSFGLGGALLAGDADTALKIARPLLAAAQKQGNTVSKSTAGVGLIALALFAPDELLAMPEPANKMMTDYWHYARGEALAARGDAAGVRTEERAMRVAPELPPTIPSRTREVFGTTYQIAHSVLLGRAAMIDRNYPAAIAAFANATKLEEGAEYSRMSDPPNWWFPVRRNLAEAKFAAGDLAGARADAELTLKRRPREPGSLALLAKMDAQRQAAR